ncbi:MAG: amidohydrolase [Lachnospiraceae bacterium]|nr:amidohydrolase [Lachnospiraceae bacterium]
MNAADFFTESDDRHIRELRHELHRHAELELELPETVAIVEAELDRLMIPHTGKYAPSSVVGYLHYGDDPENAPKVGEEGHVYTVAFRADMDALPIEEESGVPFASIHKGVMHACGHDTHTAMLLGAAGALCRAEGAGALGVRIKLIFQPNEEGEDTGSQIMIDNGVLDDVDIIYGQHISMDEPTGTVMWIKGPAMAACRTYNVTFHGKATHATAPEDGHDALMMAVKAIGDIYFMNAREIGPFRPHIISVGALHAGNAHNIIAEKAEMKISTRFYTDDVFEIIDRRIREICANAAAELSGTADVEDGASAYAVINDPYVTDLAVRAAEKITTPEFIKETGMIMGSEDFSCYQRVRPGAFFHLGAADPARGFTGQVHNGKLRIDEDAFLPGSKLLVQIALDVTEERRGD